MPPQTPDRILRLHAVLDKTGLSRSTLYRKMQDGTFPQSVRISTAVLVGANQRSTHGFAIQYSIRQRIIRWNDGSTPSLATFRSWLSATERGRRSHRKITA